MAFLSGLFSVAGAVNQIMKFVNWARSRLELAGAYVAGYLKHQKQTEDAERDERDEARDSRDRAEDMTDEEQFDILTGGDDADGVRDDTEVPSDTRSGDNN